MSVPVYVFLILSL